MARAQGAQANAKEDTVYLALAGAAATDLSQQLTNITVSGAGAFESPSARVVLAAERTVSVAWRATAAEVGVVLMIAGNTGQTDFVWGLATDGAGKICGHQDGGTVVITAETATAAKDYQVSWSMRPDPDTPGGVIPTLWVYNHSDGTTNI